MPIIDIGAHGGRFGGNRKVPPYYELMFVNEDSSSRYLYSVAKLNSKYFASFRNNSANRNFIAVFDNKGKILQEFIYYSQYDAYYLTPCKEKNVLINMTAIAYQQFKIQLLREDLTLANGAGSEIVWNAPSTLYAYFPPRYVNGAIYIFYTINLSGTLYLCCKKININADLTLSNGFDVLQIYMLSSTGHSIDNIIDVKRNSSGRIAVALPYANCRVIIINESTGAYVSSYTMPGTYEYNGNGNQNYFFLSDDGDYIYSLNTNTLKLYRIRISDGALMNSVDLNTANFPLPAGFTFYAFQSILLLKNGKLYMHALIKYNNPNSNALYSALFEVDATTLTNGRYLFCTVGYPDARMTQIFNYRSDREYIVLHDGNSKATKALYV
ncbi:hypothetical protein [Geobacillus subterraneus]|uniref:hypothetical protein n=1 Tax=Geobacillus subterraneus TaxID=129338 RepID=UPI001442AC8B|nr:hypothetical protein [Geobacillus subterraneus]QIZ66706.1 hypothetical protein HF500_05155 [Geobacillus subterraneus]